MKLCWCSTTEAKGQSIYIIQIVLVKKNKYSATVVKARYPKSNNLKLTFEGSQPLNRARF